MNNIRAPLDHIFDDYHLCDSKLRYKKRIEENNTLSADEKLKKIKVG